MATLPLSPSAETAILEETPSSRPREDSASAEMSGSDVYELIRACLSHRSESARRSALQSFLDAGIDWPLVQQEAQRHRVLLLLYRALEDVLGPRLPSSLHEQIREHRRGVRIRNTFVIQELGRIAQHFEAVDLAFLAMKGPVLAKTAYGDIALRHSVDADMFVPREHFSEVESALRDLGYEYTEERKAVADWRKALSLYLDGQWEFSRGRSFTLDVHTRLMPPGYPFPSDFQRFSKGARSVQLSDKVSVPGFAPEDQLLILAHHGIKNQWRALRHVADIAAVIRGSEDLDWELLRSQAEKMRATRVLKLGLCMAHDLLEVTLPLPIKKWALGAFIRDVAAPMKTYLRSRSQKSSLAYGERVQLQLATKDTIMGQIRYGVHSLLQHFWSTLLKP